MVEELLLFSVSWTIFSHVLIHHRRSAAVHTIAASCYQCNHKVSILFASKLHFRSPFYRLFKTNRFNRSLISQCCFGVGMGALFVLSFDDCVKEAKKYLPHNDSTMAQISGLYTSSYAFGKLLCSVIIGIKVFKLKNIHH